MKNKLLKGAHLSEKKCREILQLFCDDLTATQIAEISGVSRVTVNSYFRRIRSIIAGFCEQHNTPGNNKELEACMSNMYSKDQPGSLNGYYGFFVNNGKIGSTWLDDCCVKQLTGDILNEGGLTGNIQGCQAVADCNDWKLYWMHNGDYSLSAHKTDIAVFWAHTKGRLQKFRGLNKSTLYFHIKECEFRYNFRHNDILPVLSEIINNKQITRQYVAGEYMQASAKNIF
ncbi:MAG: hypothetical protein KF862_13000 [Chitinophagaceae bacterium]|nr:hypothetical protein [Chitinophagaceae bacterium]